jgi:hypothetical protein
MTELANVLPAKELFLAMYDTATTEELAKLTRQLIQLRAIRDFTKQEVHQAPEIDTYLWMDTNHTLVQSIKITERLIAALLPSGKYQYRRDIPEP